MMNLRIVNLDLFEAHILYKWSVNRDSGFIDYSRKLLMSFPSIEVSVK